MAEARTFYLFIFRDKCWLDIQLHISHIRFYSKSLKRTVVSKAGVSLEEAFWSQIQGAQIYFYLSFKHCLLGRRSVFKHFRSSVLRFLMEKGNYEGHVLIFHWPRVKTGWLANVLSLPTCAELPLSSIKDVIPISFLRWIGGRGTCCVCIAGIENEIFATFHLKEKSLGVCEWQAVLEISQRRSDLMARWHQS